MMEASGRSPGSGVRMGKALEVAETSEEGRGYACRLGWKGRKNETEGCMPPACVELGWKDKRAPVRVGGGERGEASRSMGKCEGDERTEPEGLRGEFGGALVAIVRFKTGGVLKLGDERDFVAEGRGS